MKGKMRVKMGKYEEEMRCSEGKHHHRISSNVFAWNVKHSNI